MLSRCKAKATSALRSGTRPYIWIYSQLLRRDGRNGETVRHTSTVVAVPSQADTQLSPMGVAWSTNALIACSLRIRSQDSPPSHGPIVLRCPGNGREPAHGNGYKGPKGPEPALVSLISLTMVVVVVTAAAVGSSEALRGHLDSRRGVPLSGLFEGDATRT